MGLIHIQIILTASHLEKLRMPSVEKDTAYHIEGNIRTNSYEKNGKKNYSTNVVVESFRLLDA